MAACIRSVLTVLASVLCRAPGGDAEGHLAHMQICLQGHVAIDPSCPLACASGSRPCHGPSEAPGVPQWLLRHRCIIRVPLVQAVGAVRALGRLDDRGLLAGVSLLCEHRHPLAGQSNAKNLRWPRSLCGWCKAGIRWSMALLALGSRNMLEAVDAGCVAVPLLLANSSPNRRRAGRSHEVDRHCCRGALGQRAAYHGSLIDVRVEGVDTAHYCVHVPQYLGRDLLGVAKSTCQRCRQWCIDGIHVPGTLRADLASGRLSLVAGIEGDRQRDDVAIQVDANYPRCVGVWMHEKAAGVLSGSGQLSMEWRGTGNGDHKWACIRIAYSTLLKAF
mmetsp:Transcript_12569/g.28409  ORF Transcript_12569/g.28409 Transcript_12569/m.28409 type:complete len:332 (-) Transcript_12569:786-1781(-)